MTVPDVGDKVSVWTPDNKRRDAVVLELLSVQFTATYDYEGSERLLFAFYNDEGTVWKKL